AGPRLETRPPEDERSMVSVLELLVGVDAAVDPDVPAATRRGDLERLGDGHLRGRGQQSSDAVPRSERPEDGSAEDEGEHTRGSEEKGTHGPDHIRAAPRARTAPGPNRAGHERTRRNLPAAWALMRSLPLACARPLRADINATGRTDARSIPVVHEIAWLPDGYPRAVPTRATGAAQPAVRPRPADPSADRSRTPARRSSSARAGRRRGRRRQRRRY